LQDALSKLGLQAIPAKGEPFDPHLHEAVETMLRLLRNDRDISLAFTSYLIQLVEQLRGGLSER
jgi:hypothetical protein